MKEELYLCAHVREFPAQALLRLRPKLQDTAVAVMDGEVPFQLVCSLNRQARKQGVARGMSHAEMDGITSVALLKRSLPEEKTARDALLECAGTFSPRVESSCYGEEFYCVLDISGTEKLFGPPQSLAIRVQQAFTALGIACSVAVSVNFHTAVCMAKGAADPAHPAIVRRGGERQALASLPLSLLNISQEHAETFSQWGVTGLGMLAMLPEKDLIARLGQEGKRLRQLARGECSHQFQPVEPELRLEELVELESPVEVLDSLLFGVSAMIGQLIARATARALSLAAVTSELGLEGKSVHARTVRPALPTNDQSLWLKLLHLDWIAHPPQVPVVSLTLRAETGVTSKVQLGLFSPQLPEPGRLDITLARIRAVVGNGRVGSPELLDTHEPDAFRMKPFSVVDDSRDRQERTPFPIAAMRRLRPPERVTVTLRNHIPHLFYFRGIPYQAEKRYGPWRVAGGWWADGRWSIEEWDIVARMLDKDFADRAEHLLCCSMTRDTVSDQWHIEALYD